MANPIFTIGLPFGMTDEQREGWNEAAKQLPGWDVIVYECATNEVSFQAFNPYQVDESQLEEFKKWFSEKYPS